MTRRVGPRLGRAVPILLTRLVVAGGFLAAGYLYGPWAVVLAMCLVSLANDLGLPAIWAFSIDVGRRDVGLVLGWSNMFGNLGAGLSPIALGWIQRQYPGSEGWNVVFFTCAAVFAVIGVAAFWIDATDPVVREDR